MLQERQFWKVEDIPESYDLTLQDRHLRFKWEYVLYEHIVPLLEERGPMSRPEIEAVLGVSEADVHDSLYMVGAARGLRHWYNEDKKTVVWVVPHKADDDSAVMNFSSL